MPYKKLITIGIPCYNEELNVIPAYQALTKITNKIKRYRFELIFVDNGSTDNTRDKIRKIAAKDKRVIGVFLSRNFGPESSGTASYHFASGDAFIGISADLQEPPHVIPKFIKAWEEGYENIFGVYDRPIDNVLITATRKIFYRIFKAISNIDLPINTTGFGMYDKKVLNVLKSLPEKYRFNRGLRAWSGFKTAYIKFKREKRIRGKSSYNFIRYIKHAERGLFGFSYLVLDLMIYFSFLLVFFSFVFIIIYLLYFFFFGNPIKGAVTILVSVIFFGGIQLLAIGIIGKYIQVIVEETKNRPVYIVDEVINYKKKINFSYEKS